MSLFQKLEVTDMVVTYDSFGKSHACWRLLVNVRNSYFFVASIIHVSSV